MMPDLSTNLAGVKLANPLIVPSGTFGFGEDFIRFDDFDNADVGAIQLKGTTLKPRAGNPPPRITETSAGVLNSIGLQNPGVEVVVGEILPRLAGSGLTTPLIANIAGETVEEYAEVARCFSTAANLAAIEVNISCPNVRHGGLAFGAEPEAAGEVIAAVRAATRLPVIAKLTPNTARITPVARACIEAGADALSLINTVVGMVIDLKSRRPLLGNQIGGLSGPAIKPIAVAKIFEVYEAVGHYVPIIGMGGVATGDDAYELLLAGACAVGVGTALFYNHRAPREILAGLTRHIEAAGYRRLSDVVGLAHKPRQARQAYETV
jgi:dihydroorotate dehydrogenase (NAD+) catalytic subunit